MEAFESDVAATGQQSWASRLVEVLQPIGARADRLASMAVFSGLARGEVEFVAGILRETLIERGGRMTVQGRPASRLWLLLEGEALVSADARPIRVVGHGDFVGLAGMLHPTASPETTTALSPIRAFEADRHGLAELMDRPSIRTRLAAANLAPSSWPSRRRQPRPRRLAPRMAPPEPHRPRRRSQAAT